MVGWAGGEAARGQSTMKSVPLSVVVSGGGRMTLLVVLVLLLASVGGLAQKRAKDEAKGTAVDAKEKDSGETDKKMVETRRCRLRPPLRILDSNFRRRRHQRL